VQAIGAVARRYLAGDLTPGPHDFGADEIGDVARALDGSVQELGRRLDELARDRARMEAMLAGMVEGVLVLNDEGRLQLANDAARRMLQLAASPVGRHYLELIRQPDVVNLLTDALEHQQPGALEISLHREPELTLFARAAPVRAAGHPGALLVLHDVTELRRADQIRGAVVANVSHELRTPLTAIRGYLEAALDPDVDPAETRRFLEIIMRHSVRMERLVHDLLRLARLDAGQEHLDRAPCATRGVIDEVVSGLGPAVEAKRQEITIDVAPETATLQVDCPKLHDILRNLIENAVNYAPEGSLITVSCRRQGVSVVLSVADEGPGIPEADLGRVFERFYRVDRARARGPGGTGLGLAIVKHLVGLHGGTVTAGNRPQGGALFTVTLPGQ
jgi:two-component system phosphate regulon sensor histidine kinase PhoR